MARAGASSSSADPNASSAGLRSRGEAAPEADAEDSLPDIEPVLKERADVFGRSSSSGIEWAPLDVPWHRRLQTFAVVLTFAIIPLSLILTLVCLFIPFLWIPFALYVAFVLTDKAGEKGGRPVKFIKDLFVWKWLRDFFPIELRKTVDLPPNRNYIFGYHPHGIISVGAFTNFGTNANDFPGKFPGIDLRLCTLAPNFKVPFLATFLLSLGIVSVSRGSITHIVRRKKNADGSVAEGTGKAAMIVVGGAEEALYAKPGSATLVLGRRFGFVKIALQNGASLVPVFSFGENDLFDLEDPTPTVQKLNEVTKKAYGVTVPLFHGRGIFSYNFGLLPYRRHVVTIVGQPIECPLIENPSEEVVREYHTKYLAGLKKIWDENKRTVYGQARAGTLEFK
ncbi:diacylglycerol acyltransferase-domain-containing protein [Hyaloraphidium curvatum]|nr:diacylglycerol acyltransferase-domain-containing protein [Hyaloraphidium curvatum]